MKLFIVVCTALLMSNGCCSQNCNQEERRNVRENGKQLN